MKIIITAIIAILTPTLLFAETITFSGTGSQTTGLFHMNAGLAIFNLTATSQDSYQGLYIKLLDDCGEIVEYLFSTYIDEDGQTVVLSTSAGIETSGSYIINIDTSGDATGIWELKITAPDASDCYTAAQLNQAVLAERSKYDPSGDGIVGLEEAVFALQVVSGRR